MATKKARSRKAKANGTTLSKGAETASSLVGDNNVSAAMDCLKKVEEWNEFLDAEKGKYMKRARDARMEISGVYATAKELGVNTKVVKTLVKTRQLAIVRGKLVEQLDIEAQEVFESYEQASWRGTPLGGIVAISDTEAGAP
jgi:uncharacterized protein (UPF0335 family)